VEALRLIPFIGTTRHGIVGIIEARTGRRDAVCSAIGNGTIRDSVCSIWTLRAKYRRRGVSRNTWSMVLPLDTFRTFTLNGADLRELVACCVPVTPSLVAIQRGG